MRDNGLLGIRLTDALDITVMDFDTEVRLARYGQQDFPRIVERIRSRAVMMVCASSRTAGSSV